MNCVLSVTTCFICHCQCPREKKIARRLVHSEAQEEKKAERRDEEQCDDMELARCEKF